MYLLHETRARNIIPSKFTFHQTFLIVLIFVLSERTYVRLKDQSVLWFHLFVTLQHYLIRSRILQIDRIMSEMPNTYAHLRHN